MNNVLFHCPCAESPADLPVPIIPQVAEPETEEPLDLDPLNSRTPYSLFPLSHLYFCEDCHTHRCPRCVLSEIVSFYCPNCLFEAPTKIAVDVQNKTCSRACFTCPICQVALQTVSIGDDGEPPYALECTYCHYSSQGSGLVFEKVSNMAAHIIKTKGSQRTTQMQMSLKYYAEQDANESREAMASIQLTSFDSQQQLPWTSTEGVQAPSEAGVVAELLSLSTLDQVATKNQRLGQAETVLFTRDLLPKPTLLLAKRSKRCRSCRHILTKPESKPLSIRFRIKLLAMNYLPNFEFTPLSPGLPLIPRITSSWVLKITNSLFDSIRVTLATKKMTSSGNGVVILCPEITIGANMESREVQRRSEASTSSGEVYQSGPNWASSIIELVPAANSVDPGQESKKIDVAIFVKVAYKTENELEKEDCRRTEKEMGFWIVVNT